MLHLLIIKYRAQLTHSILLILGLVARLGILDKNLLLGTRVGVFILIAQTHSRLHLIHILSAGAAASESIPRDARRLNNNLDAIIDKRGNKHRAERGHTLTLRVVGAHAHQTMHAILALKIAVCVGSLKLKGNSLYARILGLLKVGNSHLIAVGLGPAHIHTHKHTRPILRLGTARARVNLQHAVHLIGLLTQHILQLQLLDGSKRARISIVNLTLLDHLLAEHLHCKLHLLGAIIYLFIILNPALQSLNLFHLSLGSLCIVPESGSLSAQLLLLNLHNLLVDREILLKRRRPLLNIL